MVTFYESVEKIKRSNLVVILSADSKELPLKLDKKILEKIEKWCEENKSFFYQFFLWEKNIETLYVTRYVPEKTKDIYEFLAENVVKIPKEITLFSVSKTLLRDILHTTLLARYKFQNYKSEKKKDTIQIVCDKKDRSIFEDQILTIENIFLARDLGETPTHDLTPEKFAKLIKKTPLKNTKVTIIWPEKVEKLWLGLLKAVGWGSYHKPHLVIMERMVSKKAPTIGFVWKWVVFDTGGLNIKMPSPIGWMEIMKFDMAGAATVFAVMKELDRKKIHVNIVAALPLAENSVWAEAMRPSDILTAYNGKTVQVLNTDAEWRLILADAVAYLSKNYTIDRFITVATLTWLCVMTFGHRYAAIMGDDQEMLELLKKYSQEHFEKYWELPFDPFFIEKTKSSIADYDNHSPGVLAWTIMGGAFIYNFRTKEEKFTHIDIASVAGSNTSFWLYPKGVTWFWVESLSAILEKLS